MLNTLRSIVASLTAGRRLNIARASAQRAMRRPAPRFVESVEGRVLFAATGAPNAALAGPQLPRPDHVVVLVLEDHSYNQILGAPQYPSFTWWVQQPTVLKSDPYLRRLAAKSAVFTHSAAIDHPNQINYQALFSGLPPQDNPDKPLINDTAPNIASGLIASGQTFAGYAEGLPRIGWDKGSKGDYADVHNPWVHLKNVPASSNQPFSNFPKNHLKNLPTLSYVVPNEQHNMHSNTVRAGDRWVSANIDRYVRWCNNHNSMLVVTFDESHEGDNNIPTFFYGPMVKPGKYSQPINHYNLLNTLEQMYGVAPTGLAADATPITGWAKPGSLVTPVV